MSDHVHTGFVSFVFAGISAIVFIHLMRFAAAKMANTDKMAGFGKALGGVVSF